MPTVQKTLEGTVTITPTVATTYNFNYSEATKQLQLNEVRILASSATAQPTIQLPAIADLGGDYSLEILIVDAGSAATATDILINPQPLSTDTINGAAGWKIDTDDQSVILKVGTNHEWVAVGGVTQ